MLPTPLTVVMSIADCGHEHRWLRSRVSLTAVMRIANCGEIAGMSRSAMRKKQTNKLLLEYIDSVCRQWCREDQLNWTWSYESTHTPCSGSTKLTRTGRLRLTTSANESCRSGAHAQYWNDPTRRFTQECITVLLAGNHQHEVQESTRPTVRYAVVCSTTSVHTSNILS